MLENGKYEQQKCEVSSACNEEQWDTANTYNRTQVFATWIVKITDERSNTPNRSRKTNEKQLYFSETLVPVARIFSRVFRHQTGLIMHASFCFAATNATSLKCKWPSNQWLKCDFSTLSHFLHSNLCSLKTWCLSLQKITAFDLLPAQQAQTTHGLGLGI